jgi:GDPmannose 4,6-dehydratase
MTKALICGASGQDGAYLTQLLLEKGYEVIGTSRDASATSFSSLKKLSIYNDVRKVSMAVNDFRSVLQTFNKYMPDEVYNLAGQTSVGLSFDQPVETMESISGGTLNILEAIRFSNTAIRFYNAGSSECFGNTGDKPANETMSFHPRSPYAVAKASSHWLVQNYRESYGLFACTGILFNHESPLRPLRFVTQKIVNSACQIAKGSKEKLFLGNISIERDWGWAPDYVNAMWLMLNTLSEPEDFVIATGRTVSLEYFIFLAFSHFDLNWKDWVEVDTSLYRPSDIPISKADPRKAYAKLAWKHQFEIEEIVSMMCTSAYDQN